MAINDIFLKKNIEYLVSHGILGYDEIALSEREVLMSKILTKYHLTKKA